MAELLVWRMAAADRGVPRTGRRADSVVFGVTEDLGENGRAWFRATATGRGDATSRDPVFAEIRTSERARERAEQATGIYTDKGWVLVDGPRVVDAGNPGLTAMDLLHGGPLTDWATGIAQAVRAGDL